MATKISWADESWNPIVGCSKTSAGCQNCYAERMAGRQANMGNINYQEVVCMRPDADTVIRANQHIGKWGGNTVFVESALTKPLHWRTPRKIFVVSMGDLFHESVPFEWIYEILAVVILCPHHEFKFLTKRAEMMYMFFNQPDLWSHHLPQAIRPYLSKMRVSPPYCLLKKQIPNLHLGVTVENQDNVGRIADLVQTPAAKRFVSFEPLLSYTHAMVGVRGIDYAFIGCESGPKARLLSCTLADIAQLRDDCRNAGAKVHIKQIPLGGNCNKDITQWPKEFQVREI